jgi:hypothetical protein
VRQVGENKAHRRDFQQGPQTEDLTGYLCRELAHKSAPPGDTNDETEILELAERLANWTVARPKLDRRFRFDDALARSQLPEQDGFL